MIAVDISEIIRTRKSVRTFDGSALKESDRKKLTEYIKDIKNPYGIDVEFSIFDAAENGLSSPVISGEQQYIIGKVKKTEHCEEAFGYSFEKMVLYAWSLGIGTTWIGGTMKREKFEKAADLKENELMLCISPLGYPARKRSIKESVMRTTLRADKRMADSELFFDGDFTSALRVEDERVKAALEAVKLSPSSVNKQPWRIVRTENKYNFYKKRTIGDPGAAWDVQKIDMGIAICHFMEIAGGELSFDEPEISKPSGIEFIAAIKI